MIPDTTAESRQTRFSSVESCDFLFLALIVLAFALRLYYFFLTKDQPLWWDEAEYMLKGKALAFGTPETGWYYKGRPLLLPILAAGFFKLGVGEIAVRLLWVALSTATLFFVYRIGCLLFNKRVGLYAVALGSAFYLDLFYSTRLLVDEPQVFFVTFAAFLLVRAVGDDKAEYSAWAVAPVIMLGTTMRFTVALFFFVAAVFLIAVKRGQTVRDKRWLVSLGSAAVAFLPLLIYYRVRYGNPFLPFLTQKVLRTSASGVLLDYIRFFPNYTNVLVTLVFLAGVVFAIATIIHRLGDLSRDRSAQGYLFLLLWTIVPFLFFGVFVDHFEDRYIAMIFPAIFLLTGAGLDAGYQYTKKLNGVAATAAIFVFLVYAVVSLAAHSHSAITDRVDSFSAVRDAGLWIKARSRPDDTVATSSVPQNTYYSERASYLIPRSPEAFERLLAERRPRFLVLSIWEPSPKWAYDWPEQHPRAAAVAAVFFLDETRTRPAGVVYTLRND